MSRESEGRGVLAMVSEIAGGVLIRVKGVPGARQDRIAGVLGDRLKLRVRQPPEHGKANRAICGLLARQLGVRGDAVTIVRGETSAAKTVRVEGVGAEEATRKLLALAQR